MITNSENGITMYEWTIYSIFLAIDILGFSAYFVLRTTDLRMASEADINMLLYALLSKANSGKLSHIYRKIASEWLKLSQLLWNSANIRCYSAVACLWSLIFLVLAFPFLFLGYSFWVIFFALAAVLFLMALTIHSRYPKLWAFSLKVLDKIQVFPFFRQMNRTTEFENVIKHTFYSEK